MKRQRASKAWRLGASIHEGLRQVARTYSRPSAPRASGVGLR